MKKFFIHVQMVTAILTLTGMLSGTSLHDQRHIAQQVIAPHFPQFQSIIDKNALIELGITSDLQGCFGAPVTLFGQIVQEYLVSHPIDDSNVLTQRAHIIEALKHMPELQSALREQFEIVAQAQEGFLRYWETENEVFTRAMEKVYFSKKFARLNTNPLALEGLRGISTLGKIPSFIPMQYYFIMAPLLVEFIKDKYNNSESAGLLRLLKIPGQAAQKLVPSLINEHNPFSTQLSTAENPIKLIEELKIQPSFGDEIGFFRNPLKNVTQEQLDTIAQSYKDMGMPEEQANNLPSTAVSAGVRVAMACAWGMRAFFDVSWYRASKLGATALVDEKDITYALHNRIRSVAQLYSALDRICISIQENSAVANYAGFDALKTLCTDAKNLSTKMNELVVLLKTNALLSDNSVFNLNGYVLAAHQLMQEVKDLFGGALFAVGELEVYSEVAHVMNTRKTCFVEFTENGRSDNSDIYLINPLINVVNAYNPVVKNNVVSQDIMVGGNSDVRNMLITGPNGCGKSTVLKNLAYTIVSAQVFNIAFADSCIMTPFARVLNYSKIEDNLKEEISTFMAEAKRIEDIKHEVANTSGRVAVFVDEALTGTFTETGATMLYDFCKEMVKFEHCFLADATHFEYLTELEMATNGAILNFHLEPKELTFGQFEPVYTINRGKALWWFENSAKRESYIAWLNKRINV